MIYPSRLLRSLILLAPVALLSSISGSAIGQEAAPSDVIRGVETATAPEAASETNAPAIRLTDAQLEQMIKRRDAIRDATSSRSGGTATGLDTVSRPTVVETAESEVLQIRRNFRNTRATAVSSTLAEPAAALDNNEVFYGGNTYFSRSANHGATWTAESIPAGPADAPFACCDLDAVHKPNTDTTYHIVLYTNAGQTNGVVRIFVRDSTIAGGRDCTYLIDPGGTANNVLPDYPHLGVSNNFIYLTMNLIRNGSWIGTQVRRFNAVQMGSCQTTATTTLSYIGGDGQRILTPVENATTIMYFGLNRNSNLFRIVRLRENASVLEVFDRVLTHGSRFVNPDCRGGIGGFDYIERSTSWSIAGFRLRGAVVPGNRMWFVWNSGPDSSHAQAHLHSAIFTEPGLVRLASPAVFNQGTCFGYPAISANSFGEFGLSVAFGGSAPIITGAEADHNAARGGVAVDDANSAGNFFPVISLTANGTHNRSDGRWGDYFTIRKNDQCAHGWAATNYSLLNGNTSSAHVNARYVEFQSNLRAACP